MEINVRQVIELFCNMKIHFLFKPDGKIIYRYKDTPENEFKYNVKLEKSFHNYHSLIRISELENEGLSKVYREYKGGIDSIPLPILEREVKKVLNYDISVSTSTRGNPQTENIVLDIEI